MSWHGPYTIRELLEASVADDRDTPGQGAGIYVVTHRRWSNEPCREAGVLYVGGNTGKSERFRTRIGDLIADMFGFFCEATGHHSGGQSLWGWCRRENVHPLDLYIGWDVEVACGRCAENSAYDALRPLLNRKRPARCAVHGQPH